MDSEATKLLHDLVPFAGELGFELILQTPSEVRLGAEWKPERCTSGDTLHGGFVMSLADTAGAMVAFLNLPEGSTGTSTIESKTNFLRGVRGGTIMAIARPLHVGRSTIVVEMDVLDEEGRRVARVTQTQSVLRP